MEERGTSSAKKTLADNHGLAKGLDNLYNKENNNIQEFHCFKLNVQVLTMHKIAGISASSTIQWLRGVTFFLSAVKRHMEISTKLNIK